MPEGDTLHTIARVLGEVLTGTTLTTLDVNGTSYARRIAGRPCARVWAKGKHLLIDIDGALVLRTHLGMYGAWHRYRPGERWRRAASGARAVVANERVVFVCFRPTEVELFPHARLHRHERLARLGPDLLADAFDWPTIAQRIPRSGAHTIAELLLDQGVTCGVGNVIKTEALFLVGLHPRTPVTLVDEETLRDLFAAARRLLQQNVAMAPRVTNDRVPRRRGDPRTWVYGRAGRPCQRCGTRIEARATQGRERAEWWCPKCQPREGRATGGQVQPS